MDKALRRILFLVSAVLLAGLGFGILGVAPVFAEENDKKYEYVVSRVNGLLTVSGQYENGGTYGLGATENIEDVGLR